MGKVEALWLKRVRRGPMDAVGSAEAVEDLGLEGNANQGGRRQVTVISSEVWDALKERLGDDLDPAWRRANVMVSGLDLYECRGKRLQIGDAVLEMGGETRPCNLLEETREGLLGALSDRWGGGAYGVVRTGGTISVGDEARFLE